MYILIFNDTVIDGTFRSNEMVLVVQILRAYFDIPVRSTQFKAIAAREMRIYMQAIGHDNETLAVSALLDTSLALGVECSKVL